MNSVETVSTPILTAEYLQTWVDHGHSHQKFVEDCLSNTRALIPQTNDRSVLLFFAMTALGKHPKGTSAVADFTALFNEFGLVECANAVRTGDYQADDLSFFWSSNRDFSNLFEDSKIKPAKTYNTCEHTRLLAKTIMDEEWGDDFYVFDSLQETLAPKSWHQYIVHNATILYDTTEFAILDESGHPVPDLCSEYYQHVFFTASFGEQFDQLLAKEVNSFNAEEVLDSALMIQDLIPQPNYCHWLLDQLPRTYQLEPAQHLIMHTLAPFMQKMLEKMGIESERVIETNTSSIIKVKRLSIESSMAKHFHHPCQEMNGTLVEYVKNGLAAGVAPVKENCRHKYVYISRNRAARRRVSNETELVKCLESYDFKVLYPEDLSMAEQISVFRDASVIVTPHGAGLANILFCKEATVIEIFNQNYGTPTFRLMCQLMGLDYQHIIGKNPLLSKSEQQRVGRAALQKEDIEVDIDKLNECLQKLFKKPT